MTSRLAAQSRLHSLARLPSADLSVQMQFHVRRGRMCARQAKGLAFLLNSASARPLQPTA